MVLKLTEWLCNNWLHLTSVNRGYSESDRKTEYEMRTTADSRKENTTTLFWRQDYSCWDMQNTMTNFQTMVNQNFQTQKVHKEHTGNGCMVLSWHEMMNFTLNLLETGKCGHFPKFILRSSSKLLKIGPELIIRACEFLFFLYSQLLSAKSSIQWRQ